MYSETGRMCAVLANPDRPRWKSKTAPEDAELRSAFDGLVAYCGTYEINEAEGYVVHHIEMDKVPNLAGTDVSDISRFRRAVWSCVLPCPCPQAFKIGP